MEVMWKWEGFISRQPVQVVRVDALKWGSEWRLGILSVNDSETDPGKYRRLHRVFSQGTAVARSGASYSRVPDDPTGPLRSPVEADGWESDLGRMHPDIRMRAQP